MVESRTSTGSAGMAASTLVGPGGPRHLPSRLSSRRFSGRVVFIIATLAVLLYLVLGPFLVLVLASFEDTSIGLRIRPPIPWTLSNYSDGLFNTGLLHTLLSTAIFGIGSIAFAFVVSVALSIVIERTDMPFRTALFVLLVAPSGIPMMIFGMSWSMLLNPSNGVLNVALRSLLDTIGVSLDGGPINVYSMAGLIIVQGMALVPLTFLLVTSSVQGMNGSLEEAARASGANTATVLRTITLPVLKPGIAGALIFQLVTVISVLDIPLILGTPGDIRVLSLAIYDASHPALGLPNNGVASAYGVLLVCLSLIPLFFYNRVIQKHDAFVTTTGKARALKQFHLGKWKTVALVCGFGYACCSFLLPLAVLVWASLQPYLGKIDWQSMTKFTVNGYEKVLSDPIFYSTLGNTLMMGATAAIVAIALSTAVSWVIVRSKSRIFSGLVDGLAFLPHAFPGVVIGLATLFLYLIVPVPVFGTIWIIVIAMATQFVGLGSRLTTAAISQIHLSLEESSRSSGASGFQTVRRILLPLLRPALFNGLLLIFLSSVQNLTLPLMLGTGDNMVLASLIYRRWFNGRPTDAATLGVILCVVTILLAILLRGSSRRRSF